MLPVAQVIIHNCSCNCIKSPNRTKVCYLSTPARVSETFPHARETPATHGNPAQGMEDVLSEPDLKDPAKQMKDFVPEPKSC